jgi:hypothetical protein
VVETARLWLNTPMPSPVEYARRINRTWIVHGNLAQNAESYLSHLEATRPELLKEVCERAVQAARQASHEHRDPKPDFYAALFSRSTPDEQEMYLKNHFWTRRLLQQ